MSSVALSHQLSALQLASVGNFGVAVLSCVYGAHNLIMLLLTFLDHNDDDCGDPFESRLARCGSPVSDEVFHLLDFWPTFAFALLTSFSFAQSSMRIMLMLEVSFSFVPAMLVTLDLKKFEVLSHEIEYLDELARAILLAALLRKARVISALIPCAQLLSYNCLADGERISHYFEFCSGLFSAAATFWLCMDNKIQAESEIICICQAQGYCRNLDSPHSAIRRRSRRGRVSITLPTLLRQGTSQKNLEEAPIADYGAV
ncbi:hypothetical protein CTAYLR_010600 [Chrysophaeum taylorii]|uniref:Uncharacterized protein n=1 Tax=Chrysophaeum taylorii TaxID=2483200 RepID=A0AAD7UD36_9STRA|nr:hypothetical protein CTAYLR_010600 [Chrysophaeum taylorii]